MAQRLLRIEGQERQGQYGQRCAQKVRPAQMNRPLTATFLEPTE